MCWGRRGTLTFCWRWSLRVWWLVLCRSRMIGDDRTPPTSSGCIPALASCRYVASYHSLPLSEWKESKKQEKTYELKIKHEKRIRKVNGFIIFGCKACLEDEKWLSKRRIKLYLEVLENLTSSAQLVCQFCCEGCEARPGRFFFCLPGS